MFEQSIKVLAWGYQKFRLYCQHVGESLETRESAVSGETPLRGQRLGETQLIDQKNRGENHGNSRMRNLRN